MRVRVAYPSGYDRLRILRMAGATMNTLMGFYLYGAACFVSGLVAGIFWERS